MGMATAMAEASADNDPVRGLLTQAPLFVLSFRHRDELASAASLGGWQTIAARRAENAEQRFATSGAMIAVVDARGAFADGLAAVRRLSGTVELTAAALFVLVSRTDIERLDDLIDAGATHYLASPFKDSEFIRALRFAERYAVRLAGGWNAVAQRREVEQEAALTWQMDIGIRTAEVSEGLRKRLRLHSRTVRAATLFGRLSPHDRASARAALRRLIASGNPTAFAHQIDQQRVAHHLRIDPARQTLSGTIETSDAASSANSSVSRDSLTGLRDAAAARRWIDQQLAAGSRSFHILLLAVTQFEMINAAFGRDTGDDLLCSIARIIASLVDDVSESKVLIARTGGAEFIIGLDSGIAQPRAMMLAEHLLDQIERPLNSGAHQVTLSCRIAIVETAHGDKDAQVLLRRASAALADAKGSDQAHIHVVSRADDARAKFGATLGADLRAALDRDEIDILFQPQVSIANGRIVGVEALSRWAHPEHGELGAATLFAVAEQSDYVVALSQHIQARAAAIAASWPASLGNVRLAINVTANDFARAGFADTFLAMIDASGFPRGRLTVEITESGLIEDLNAAATLLATLRAGGCRVAIDDFGTGYSSLAYLKALPLDYLKIDKQLAQDIEGSPRDRIVVRGVIDMARSLGLAVIAEGVETEQQLTLLAREGCNYYQGFLCAAPLSVGALIALVE